MNKSVSADAKRHSGPKHSKDKDPNAVIKITYPVKISQKELDDLENYVYQAAISIKGYTGSRTGNI